MVFKPQRFHDAKSAAETANPSAARLEVAAAKALASSQGLDASELTVVAKGQEIVLGGRITSRLEIDRAVDIIMSVPGVEKVTVTIASDEAP
ncbi:transport-associated protein [Rhizobium sp. PDO1-076]|uniref:BON domain-containing protein n=1 Tax=Rhizobium sp. PDO1-076 TaxID=1125979 RepID=UPI00024E35F0|nr:BON domain-containing protein [Rhizobium sp. PDO1-076]EHS50801.1 transport-associated protein [Rhizobium sp. PDO1-076]